MKAIQIMFESLNRRLLEPYGGTEVHTPHFNRLAAPAVTFDRAYVGPGAGGAIRTARPDWTP